ncbi:hypothetical protein KM427_12170 [Nocardioides sp. LMS-CY]|uniref:Uncharacterized protein n=1 Tax=Nocardioides soli TaxID=1036020 RepID=A0A7W4W009_9ACTN|nr:MULTISPECIES: hypothetical protein [Nocardioides]MBB3044889.1 hypothetical protein [Nocardioides soli]QWF24380.1 hypothetical protein KM427_12170 [Nocardioides sp. LMS-CY]
MIQSRAAWQPGEGSRLWGYLLPMLLVLPIVLLWAVVLLTLAWEQTLLLSALLTVAAVAASWWLYLRTLGPLEH